MPVYHSAPSCRRQAEAERAQFIILNRSQPGLPRSSSSLSPVFGRTPNASPESSRVVLTDVEGTRGVDISTNGAHYTEGLYVYDVAFQSIKTHLYVTICRHSPANQRRFRGFTCTYAAKRRDWHIVCPCSNSVTAGVCGLAIIADLSSPRWRRTSTSFAIITPAVLRH